MSTILIVDDSKFSRGRVVAALAPLGHRLLEAESGSRAIEQMRQQLPDLLITDLLMPDVDGFGVLAALRNEGLPVRSIVISADIQASSRVKASELGALALINKPFSPDELSQTVSRILDAVPELQACH